MGALAAGGRLRIELAPLQNAVFDHEQTTLQYCGDVCPWPAQDYLPVSRHPCARRVPNLPAARSERLKNTPVWVFHAAEDELVPLSESQQMVDALKECGGKVEFTVYPNCEHDS
jgi:acetyl esterase/lipase